MEVRRRNAGAAVVQGVGGREARTGGGGDV